MTQGLDLTAIAQHVGVQSAPGTGGVPAQEITEQQAENIQTNIQPEGIDVKVTEVKSTEPPFTVKEFTTSVKISASGTYSSFERSITLAVNTTDPDLIVQGKNQAVQQTVAEALNGMQFTLDQGRAKGIIK